MKKFILLHATLCLTIAFSLAPAAHAQIQNGGFETGDFSHWVVNDSSMFTTIGTDPAFNHSGAFFAYLGATPNFGTLSQTFSTTPGQTFNLSFWLASDITTAVNNSFEVLWNGVSVLSLTNVPSDPNVALNPYVNYTVPSVTASAGATSTLVFRYQNNDDFFRLDDVSVAAVPEPSTVSFALLGLALLCVGRRRLRAFQRICFTR